VSSDFSVFVTKIFTLFVAGSPTAHPRLWGVSAGQLAQAAKCAVLHPNPATKLRKFPGDSV